MNIKYLLRFTNLLFVAALVLLTACSSSGQQTQPADAAPSRTPVIISTATPTMTPTYYFVRLPASIQSDSGWKINLSALDLQTALGATKSKNKMFLVVLVEIENLTGKSDCIKSDQFMLQNGLQKIKMERDPLEAGKSAYARDYPGTILGQCLDANEKQESVPVFDIPATSEDLSLSFQEQTMRLGKIEAIRNPLPTLTPTATAIVPPTATFTPTLTPNATVIPSVTSSQEILTIENNKDMAALFKVGDNDPFVSEFAEKYSGRTIQFDGYIANMMPYENYTTRFDLLIFTGNYGEKSGNSLNFKFENINIVYDLKLTGSNIPEYIREGQNLRITAKVKEYNEVQDLFYLEPVSTEIR